MNRKITIKMPEDIQIDDNVRFGKPRIRGTRIAIIDILNLLNSGYDINEIPGQYPNITATNVKNALEYTVNVLGREKVLELDL